MLERTIGTKLTLEARLVLKVVVVTLDSKVVLDVEKGGWRRPSMENTTPGPNWRRTKGLTYNQH